MLAVRAGGKWERFHRDMLQLFTNAKLYNVEGSSVYNDAVELEAVFRAQPSPKRVSSYGSDYLPMVDVSCAACNTSASEPPSMYLRERVGVCRQRVREW